MKNKLILVTVVRKILNIFDTSVALFCVELDVKRHSVQFGWKWSGCTCSNAP